MRLDQTWHLFAWLIVTAVVYYYVGKLVVVLFLCWLALIGWLWFARRWPRICSSPSCSEACSAAEGGGGGEVRTRKGGGGQDLWPPPKGEAVPSS